MTQQSLRAWWWAKQGLDGSLIGKTAREALLRAGWSRSVGGANPYMSVFARTGAPRASIDAEAGNLQIQELPSARGCTHVLPAEDFALGLGVAQGSGAETEIVNAKRFLGVTDEELGRLAEATLRALEAGPLDPKQIKDAVGGAARSLGEEGKKRGINSTLPLVLGRLQIEGSIRRVPIEGRLDRQRYRYALWRPNPLAGFGLSREEAFTELGRRYFSWIGPASLGHFQWFSGLGVKAASEALNPLGLVPVAEGTDLVGFPSDVDALRSFAPPKDPVYNLVASLDSVLLLRRDLASLLDEEDSGRETATATELSPISGLQDLYSNAILDRGRLIGLWEFEPSSGTIAWTCFVERNDALKAEVARTEAFIRDQLEDCRSFSLDSPESRKPRIANLRLLADREAAPVR